MQRKLVLEFTKMNGAGNDFIVIDNRFYHFSDDELGALARRFCHRRFGIGADGLLAFAPARAPEVHHYRMRYLNADGTVGTMCGNGARCLVRYGRYAGVTDAEVRFESDAGVVRARSPEDPAAPVRIYLGPPRDYTPALPLAAGTPAGPAHYIWTGTEHLVCFVDDVRAAPVDVWGPALRHDAALRPNGANVDFVEVIDDGAAGEPAVLRARTYEKGVEAETYACGTGAMAAALVARFQGRVARDTVAVEMPGGTLRIGFALDGSSVGDVYLEGPAEVVFRGTVEV